MNYTPEQKKKLRKVLVKSTPKEASLELLSDSLSDIKDSLIPTINKALTPHVNNILILKDVLSDVPNEIEKSINKLDSKTTKTIHDNHNKIISNIEKVDREIKVAISNLSLRAEEDRVKGLSVDDRVKFLEKEVKDLWWSRKVSSGGGGGPAFLASLTDVVITSPTTGQGIVYSATLGKWVNGTVSGSTVTLKTNGTNNGSQTILNLKQGTNVTLADDGVGGVTINSTAGGSGTVTSTSVTSANGFAGTVATSTTTPAISISTTVTGIIKGNGTAISAAVANTDYQSPITLTTTGTSGAATLVSNTLNIPQYTGGSGGITWTEITTTSQTASINNGYLTNNVALVTVTLPTTAAVGSIVRVGGSGAGGWKVAQNASGQINFGNQFTTVGVGGSLASVNRYDAVELICVTANNIWSVISSQGNVTIV